MDRSRSAALPGDAGATGEQTRARVLVRYWAAARAAAGCLEDEVDAHTVAEALARVREHHREQPRFAEILAASSLLLSNQPVGKRDPADVAVQAGDVIEVLPPFAGG